MMKIRLHLNDRKTEYPGRHRNNCRKNNYHTFLSHRHDVTSFSTTEKNLGFDCGGDLRIHAHVQDICAKKYIDIRRSNSIAHLLSIGATNTLFSAFVLQ